MVGAFIMEIFMGKMVACWFACFGSYGFHTDSKGMAWLDFLPGFGKELRIPLLPL